MVLTDPQDSNKPSMLADDSDSSAGGLPPGWGDKIKQPAQPLDGFAPSGERKEAVAPQKERVFKEKVPIVEVGPPKELGPEVKDWMERLETGEEVQLPQPVTDDTGQVIVDTPTPRQVEVKLPLSETEIQGGLHQEIIESVRWLAEWCKRLLKKIGGKFFYKTP